MQQFFYGGSGGSGQSVQKPKQVPYRRNENRPSLSKPSYISEIKKRLADIPEGCSEEQAIDWGFIYTILAPADHESPISVKRIKDFMELRVRKSYPDLYERMTSFLKAENADAILSASDRKMAKKFNTLSTEIAKLRTIDNAYEYSLGVHDAVEEIAHKLDAPDDMNSVTKAKWLRLWIIIRGEGFFLREFTPEGDFLGWKKSSEVDQGYFYPEDLIFYWRSYFNSFEDGDFVFEQIKSLIEIFPKDVQEQAIRFAELDNPECAEINNIGIIRSGLIKKIFPVQWMTHPDYFIVKKGIEKISEDFLRLAVKISNDKKSKLKVTYFPIQSPYEQTTCRATAYCMGEVPNKQTGKMDNSFISDFHELLMLVKTYQWLEAHPDFKFGYDKKTIPEYGMCGLKKPDIPEFKEIVASWIMSMGLVNSEKNINWEVANMIFKPEKFETIMVDYFKGEASLDDVFQKAGFVDRTQAITCLNLKANIGEAEIRRMLDSLRKVKMFKVKHSSPYYLIYVMFFGYLKNQRPELLKEDDLKKYSELIPLVA